MAENPIGSFELSQVDLVSVEFVDRFEKQRVIEAARFEESARRARVLMLTLPPLGIAVAMVIQYLALIDLLANADYYYVLERPAVDVYARLAVPAIIGGLIATVIVTGVFTLLAEADASAKSVLTIGIFYGVLMPMFVGLLMPLNLFVLSQTGLSRVTNQGSLEQQVGDFVFSIPGSVYLNWLLGTSWGLLAGFSMAGLAWVIFRLAGPISNPRWTMRIYLASLATAVAVVALVISGPLPILEFLHEQYTET